MADADVVHAGRCEWRADLHEFAAAGKASFGDQAGAEASLREAANLRREADLATRYQAAKEAGDELQMDSLAQELRAHRKQWRTERSDPGRGVPALSIVNNFEEPSDADHLAASGGKSK